MKIRVKTNRVARRCRAGLCFTSDTVSANVTEAQHQAIIDDPMLVVVDDNEDDKQEPQIVIDLADAFANADAVDALSKKPSVEAAKTLSGLDDIDAAIRDRAWKLFCDKRAR